ncbi:hypothetical protein KEJ19_07610 [Candidatus Bathyarchaeota archaeon]|nr:hypothetical protein [Candidatus Bathyarchaeota archaeon]
MIDESGNVIGIVTMQDALKIPEEKRNNVSIGEI